MLIVGTCWTIFVFISMLKTHCLLLKIAMLFFGPPHHHHHPHLWVSSSLSWFPAKKCLNVRQKLGTRNVLMFKCSEQLLFSCVSSKVSICNYVTCRMSHVTCHMSNAYVDHWDMLNNFCFHLYAPNSLFIAENCNGFFGHPHHPILLV